MIELLITPIGKPRMTRSDKWKKRPCVVRYWEYKNSLIWLLKQQGIHDFPDNIGALEFVLPMPDSWSAKKKELMNGTPHQQKPDLDNILKGILDAVKRDDKTFYTVSGPLRKTWGYQGRIIIGLND